MAKLYLAAGIGQPSMFTRIFSGFHLEPFLQATNDLALRRQLGLAENDFVIGNIGRLFRLKGHADLITAFAGMLPRVPHARLLLVGDGLLRGELETQARSLGLAGKVVFTGLVPPGEVARYVGIMDCLAHLSYREALSRALPQALAAGKPVVAYDFDGADEVCLENETGFVVPTGDTAAAAQRLWSTRRGCRAPRTAWPDGPELCAGKLLRRKNGGRPIRCLSETRRSQAGTMPFNHRWTQMNTDKNLRH